MIYVGEKVFKQIVDELYPCMDIINEIGFDRFNSEYSYMLNNLGNSISSILIDNGYVHEGTYEVIGDFENENYEDLSEILRLWHVSHEHQNISVFAYDVIDYMIDLFGGSN